MPVPYLPSIGGPVYSRKQLRQRLGRDFLHDTHVGLNSASLGSGFGSAHIIDPYLADVTLSGEMKYTRSWARHNGMTMRCATFNFASGAFISLQTTATTIMSGGEWELHELISPDDKDIAIDWAMDRIWLRQEVAINAVDGLTFYSAGYEFGQVFDWWVNSSPDGTESRTSMYFRAQRPEIRLTGSGRELRIDSGIQGSQQIILDAEVRISLGSSDTATVNLPSRQFEHMVLYAAEAQCWEMLSKRAPAEDRRHALRNAQRASAAYSRLSSRFTPQRDYAPRFRRQVV